MLELMNATDPYANALAGALLIRDNKNILQSKNLTTDAGSLYAAHFLGAGGASKLLAAPESASAADVAGEKAAKANKEVFYDKATGRAKTVGELRAFLSAKATTVTDIGQTPTSLRAVSPLASATTELTSAQGKAPVVVMANNISAGGGGRAAASTPIPVPIRTRDESITGLQTINAI
jgi:hypothetical protein